MKVSTLCVVSVKRSVSVKELKRRMGRLLHPTGSPSEWRTKSGTSVGRHVYLPKQRSTGNLPLEPQSRADALRRLEAVAAYFRRTEPHSPVAYLVERAVRWGAMPLEEWLREIIKSDDVLGSVKEHLGIKDLRMTVVVNDSGNTEGN